MQAITNLQRRWDSGGRIRRLHANLVLERDGVVLGANTVLSKRSSDGALESDEPRTLTLLSVAYGHPVDPSILRKFRYASKHARAGNEAMAAMHIALTGLPALGDPVNDARRLFIADGLLKDGVAPRDIWTALEFDPVPLDALTKFNPDEPRVPAGSGRPSGEWSSGGAPSDVLQPPIPPPAAPPAPAGESAVERALEAAETAARATARRYAPEVLGIAERAAPPVAFVSTLLDSTSAEGDEIKGDVVGRPDLYWSRRQDETDVRIVRRSDNQVVALLHLGAEDSLVDNSDRVVGRSRKDKVIVDATVLPTSGPSSITRSDEPDLCPKPTDDRDGRVGPVGEKDKDYEDHVKEIVNPGNPTDRGMGYKFPNPKRPRYPVIYDDCRHRTGDLIEAKGTGYVAMLEKPGGLMKEILNFKWKRQATNQIDASQGRELEWYFAEKGAADDARELFDDKPELERIHVIYEYWRPGMR